MRLFPPFSTDKVNSRITLGFALATALISVGFALSFYSYSRSQQDGERITHTFLVINSLEDILSSTKDVETGTRGYLASYDTSFLQSAVLARPRIRPELRYLHNLTADNPAQQREVNKLATLIKAKLTLSNQQARLTSQSPDSVKKAALLLGKTIMDKVRQQTARMIQTEQILMKQRGSNARNSFRSTLLISFSLSILTFAVLLISYNLLSLELRRRAENESQLRDYETELQKKIEQLEVSNQELERFAFVASHDMQEPLRKIQTFGDLLNQHYPPDTDGRKYIAKMLTSADRMSKLIRDLLTFSRLKNQPAPFQQVVLGDSIDRVLSDLELPIKTSGAIICVGPMPTIDAVPSQMDQLLTNLIGNAIKYVGPDVVPKITITAQPTSGETYPGLHAELPYFRLSVTDNGIGFDEKYLDRIFDVFQRLHAKGNYEGTGVGLAICKRVVTYHNGYITAKSKEGTGTTFMIVLPETQANVPVVGREEAGLT